MATRLITAEELIEAPTGFDWNDVADSVGAGSALEAIEQLRVIDRASDEACRYIFNSVDARIDATSDTELRRVGSFNTNAWIDNTGQLVFRASFFPILGVSALTWAIGGGGIANPTFNSLDPTAVIIFGEGTRKRRIIDRSMDWRAFRGGELLLQATYTNGWPNAVLTSSVTAGPNVSLPLDTSTGFGISTAPQGIGLTATIYDGVNTETVSVSSAPDGTHILIPTLQFAHNSGVGVSAVPPALKWGVILACTHFGRFRGSDAVTFIGRSGASKQEVHQSMDALIQAHEMWDEFKIRS